MYHIDEIKKMYGRKKNTTVIIKIIHASFNAPINGFVCKQHNITGRFTFNLFC